MAYSPSYADAISGIESGGNYSALGPQTRTGDRAYGKYQVMGENIPQWSKEVLGREMTPQEFLSDPKAQDAVFQGKFGQYVDKYGPEGAAQAWFGGPGAVGKTDRKDVLGTSVGSYGQRFMNALGQPEQAQAAAAPSVPATPPPAAAPASPANLASLSQAAIPMPAYGWSPTAQSLVPQQPAPLPLQKFVQDFGAAPPPPDLSKLQPLLANAPASIRGLIFRG